MERLGNRELRFVIVFAAALAVFTTAPYVAGGALPFPGTRFEGMLTFEADFHSYLAFMRQARDGAWLFYNPFTSEPHRPALFNLEWLIFGKLAVVLGGSLEAALQVERIGSIFLLACGVYRLGALVLQTVWMRRLTLVLMLLGGGCGWIPHVPGLRSVVPHFTTPDMYMGLHPFFWMLVQPHFLLAQTLAVWTMVMVLEGRYRWAGVLLAVTGAVRPFDMLQLSAALALYGVLRRQGRVLGVVLAPLPLWLYYLWVFRLHPVFQWWGIQNVFPPPRPALLAGGLGILFVLWAAARFGLPQLGRSLLSASALAALVLLYAFPLLSFSLQVATTLAIPAALVAAARFQEAAERHRWAAMAVVAAACLTSAVLWRSTIFELQRGRHRIDADRLAAYHWLGQNSQPRDLVLASAEDSNRLPRYTHNTVFWGYLSTVNQSEKAVLVEQFFRNWRREFLAAHRVRYLLMREPPPTPAPFLQEVFHNRAAIIYRVLP